MSHLGTLADHFHLGTLLDHARTQIFVSLSWSQLFFVTTATFSSRCTFLHEILANMGYFVSILCTFGALLTGLNCAVEPKNWQISGILLTLAMLNPITDKKAAMIWLHVLAKVPIPTCGSESCNFFSAIFQRSTDAEMWWRVRSSCQLLSLGCCSLGQVLQHVDSPPCKSMCYLQYIEDWTSPIVPSGTLGFLINESTVLFPCFLPKLIFLPTWWPKVLSTASAPCGKSIALSLNSQLCTKYVLQVPVICAR